jgi:hypothetical protein
MINVARTRKKGEESGGKLSTCRCFCSPHFVKSPCWAVPGRRFQGCHMMLTCSTSAAEPTNSVDFEGAIIYGWRK